MMCHTESYRTYRARRTKRDTLIPLEVSISEKYASDKRIGVLRELSSTARDNIFIDHFREMIIVITFLR